MCRTLKKINSRTTESQSDRHRLSIQTAKLIKRLQDASDGTVDMSPIALKATQILLDKSLPNLQAIEMTNEPVPENHPEQIQAELEVAIHGYLEDLMDDKMRELLYGDAIKIMSS